MTLTERLFARTEPLRISGAVTQAVTSLVLILVAVSWAAWAQLEEQIRAPGTVIVSSRSQVIQAVDGGVLRKLAVREGDSVKSGDVLAELDTVRFAASSEEIRVKLVSLRAAIQRAEAELMGQPLKFSADVREYPDIVESQSNLYDRRLRLQREETEGLEQSLKLAKEELDLITRLSETGDASRTEVLKSQRQVSELAANIINKRNGYRQEAQAELAKNRSELEQAEQVFTQRQQALESTKIRAPMSGVIKNVGVTTMGAVLKAGDELMQIVPSDEPLIIEAKVKPADVAFVRRDLRANVKLDAYDYTVYGSMKGHVTYISADTLEENLKKDEEPYYRVHIQIDEFPEKSKGKIEVIPGMTSQVEIITGERTVLQYVLKPLRRVSSEALVER
jgi:membrane fusion protein, adhesin transport system